MLSVGETNRTSTNLSMMASLACVEDKMKTSGLVNGGTTTTTTSQSTLLEEMKLLKDQSGFHILSSSIFLLSFPF